MRLNEVTAPSERAVAVEIRGISSLEINSLVIGTRIHISGYNISGKANQKLTEKMLKNEYNFYKQFVNVLITHNF